MSNSAPVLSRPRRAKTFTNRISASFTPQNDKNRRLRYFATFGEVDAVEYYLDLGADINNGRADGYKDVAGTTALMVAAWDEAQGSRKHLETVKLLIDRGADLNLQRSNGDTALILATEKGHTEIVKLLIDSGANLNLKNNNGETALMIARQHNYMDIIDLIESALPVSNMVVRSVNEKGEGAAPLQKAVASEFIQPNVVLPGQVAAGRTRKYKSRRRRATRKRFN